MDVPFKKARWLSFSNWSHVYLLCRVGLGEELAGHEAFLKTGGTQAGEQVEIGEVGDLADEGVQVAGEGHPAGPGAGDGVVLQEWEEFKRVGAVGIDAVWVGGFGRVELPVAAEDDLTAAGLPPVEVAGESPIVAMGEFEGRLLVAVGVGVPVEVRCEGADAVKDAGWDGSGGPHLAAHGVHGDGETEHGTQGAAPWPGC